MQVVVVDTDAALIAELQLAPSVAEPGLTEAWKHTEPLRTCTTNLGALLQCQIVFITKDVPTGDTGKSDLGVIEDLMSQLAHVLDGSGVPVVLMAQIQPGTTRRFAGQYDNLAYQVETLVFGDALNRALHPERHIIGVVHGGRDPHSCHREWLEHFPAEQFVMALESAELAKIAINLFLAASVSTTNSLAELARAVGADWHDIAPTLRADRRIGSHAYLSPGLGLAGGNIERDLASFLQLAVQHDVHATVIESYVRSSKYHRGWALRQLAAEGHIGSGVIAILGLAYKPDTASTKNSASLELLQHLGGQSVRVHDPQVQPVSFASSVTRCSTWTEAVTEADAVVVMTAWSNYAEIDVTTLARLMRGRLVLDPFGVLDADAMSANGLNHRVLTRGG
jgi:UDPglucose 6-dehydrogenase